ncbi:MAG TPA: hypothetical protein VFV76_10210 [Actinomycetes bacterium]|nr:hypothetical protein [Actinomycetes bacterium]
MRRVQLVALPALAVASLAMLLAGELWTVVSALALGALAGVVVWVVQRARAR